MTDVGARPGGAPDPASADAEPRQTVAIPRPEIPPASQSTVVIEDGVIPRRLRRPLDLARFLVAK